MSRSLSTPSTPSLVSIHKHLVRYYTLRAIIFLLGVPRTESLLSAIVGIFKHSAFLRSPGALFPLELRRFCDFINCKPRDF